MDVHPFYKRLRGWKWNGPPAWIGIYPWIHPILFAIRNWFTGESKTGIGYITHLTQNLITAHQKKPKNLDLDNENTSRMDFLSKYMARHRQDPGSYNSWYVLSGCASNMAAGSDTTGISLSAVLHFLLQYPHTVQRLRQEVDDWQKQNIKSRHISFSDSQSMPYLQAVINEALRLHPATGLPLERVVPDQGATIAGQIFQPQVSKIVISSERISALTKYIRPLSASTPGWSMRILLSLGLTRKCFDQSVGLTAIRRKLTR